MLAGLDFKRDDRVLVFAPHPDDETLAAGDAIQSAHAGGAAVRVLFATDGDNNPWPQRWLEKRWTISAADKARWGARRRNEAIASLAVLGIDSTNAVFLGWPDQGLTERLMDDASAVERIAGEIDRYAPTHVVMPMLGDRHPDHSALRVMCELALLRSSRACTRLGYAVHVDANVPAVADVEVFVAGSRKIEAMQAHASQLALSRKRLLAVAARPERFEIASASHCESRRASTIRVHAAERAHWRRAHQLLIVLATRAGDRRIRLPVSALSSAVTRGGGATAEWNGDDLRVALPRLDAPLLAIYAKLERSYPRLIVFDRELWHAGDALLADAVPGAFHDTAADVI